MKNSIFIITILIPIIFFSSCSSYQATVKKQENLSYESVKVSPDWKYKKPGAKKMIVPLIGLSAGAAYGFQNEFSYEGETYSGKENALIWGGVGLLTGALINGVLFPKKGKKKKFDLSQSQDWLDGYNKSTEQDYMIQKQENNQSLVLVPKYKVEQYRGSFNELKKDLESNNPSTNFSALQDWKSKLNREYSILPDADINRISTYISSQEEQVADKELIQSLDRLSNLDNSCLLYTSPSPRDRTRSRMPSSA